MPRVLMLVHAALILALGLVGALLILTVPQLFDGVPGSRRTASLLILGVALIVSIDRRIRAQLAFTRN